MGLAEYRHPRLFVSPNLITNRQIRVAIGLIKTELIAMLKKIGRFIGAVTLAVITTFFVNSITLLSYGCIAHIIQNLHNIGFLDFIIYSGIIGIVGSIVIGIATAIGFGLIYTSQKSIFIALVVILIFLNALLNDYTLLLGDLPLNTYSDQAISMIKKDAGSFYGIGAIITLIVDFLCYLIYSATCFIDPEEM